MRRMSATEAARRFSDLLDAVEARGETFVVVRHGRAVAQIGPAAGAHGRAVKDLLRRAPADVEWADQLRDVRAAARLEEPHWNG